MQPCSGQGDRPSAFPGSGGRNRPGVAAMCCNFAAGAQAATIPSSMGTTETTLVITDGGPASLLACWAEGVCRPAVGADSAARLAASRQGVAAWAPSSIGVPAAAAIDRFAEVCHLTRVLRTPIAGDAGGRHADLPAKLRTGLAASELLMAACIEALRHNIHRVIWPIQLGGPNIPTDQINLDELDLVADAFDRALLCARLLAIDAGPRGLLIETPYIDFTDAQLMDLAADMDAPVNLAWWCRVGQTTESVACGSCPECLRWSQALLEAGLHSLHTPEIRVLSKETPVPHRAA